MKLKGMVLIVTIFLVLGIAGCGSYYQVRDPASDSLYYTTDIEKKREGAITFKDAKSGADVTLQNSEVKEISKDEFKESTKKEE
jgi:hypothetical protein